MEIRGLWSVITVKWSRPARKRWHFLIAQAMSKHSSSITAYLVSVSMRNHDPACTTRQSEVLSVCRWRRRKPNPKVLASVYRWVSFEASKLVRMRVTAWLS